jgi:alcohol dehydrogenase class IV
MQLGAVSRPGHRKFDARRGPWLANPLTTHFAYRTDRPWSDASHVIRFNAAASACLSELLESVGGCAERPAGGGNAAGLADFVTALARRAGLEIRLAACGVEESHLPMLAAAATREWTTSFNPRPADAADLLAVYRQAF